MGYDAYHLVAPLFAASTGMMPEIDGATGRLYLDVHGRVHRRLAWAEFRRGEPVPVPDPGEQMIPELGEDGDRPDDGSSQWYEATREL